MIPSSLDGLSGNTALKEAFLKMAENRAIGHSMLFVGPDGIGKGVFALALAAMAMGEPALDGPHSKKIRQGIHPDVHVYRPEGKLGLHSIQTLRDLTSEVAMPPFEAPYKVLVIHEADRMLNTGANALLKTFEEPPPRTLIILLSQFRHKILPTILSRCRSFYFQPLTQDELRGFLMTKTQLAEPRLSYVIQQAEGSVARALQLAQQEADPNREMLFRLLTNESCPYDEIKKTAQQLAEKATAAVSDSEDKETQGKEALAMLQESDQLFTHILSWFRDLTLLVSGGDRRMLMNPDYEEGLLQRLQWGHIPPLEQVQKYLTEAKRGLERSTSLHLCLENLFLKLG